ncbi:MAG: hypothetical protein ACRCZF_20065 [Gemmataceae bacterium]
MAYSDFDLRTVARQFRLRDSHLPNLFEHARACEPGPNLVAALGENAPIAAILNTERARSEYIIAPVLLEVRRLAIGPLTVFPGATLTADRDAGLTGTLDYLIARTEPHYYVRAPLVAVVEGKRDNLVDGLGQCAAAMVAMRLFNAQDGHPTDEVGGAVTSGTDWKFLKLFGDELIIDEREYSLDELPQILGILVAMTGTGAHATAA